MLTQESVIRLACFASVFLLMMLWEVVRKVSLAAGDESLENFSQ
jgi:hypothetical protein